MEVLPQKPEMINIKRSAPDKHLDDTKDILATLDVAGNISVSVQA